ncbi:putative LOC729966 homolog isoform X1 [Pogona vitticeps]
MAVWPLFLLVAFAPELLSMQPVHSTTVTAVSKAPATTLASSLAVSGAEMSTRSHGPRRTTSNQPTKIVEAHSAHRNTSVLPPASTRTETPATKRMTERPGSATTGWETSTMLETSNEPPASPGKEPASHTTVMDQPGDDDDTPLSQKPGLIAVICIFMAILLIGAVVILVKFCHSREPSFKKLDEVPMGRVTEDSPFARYPPK